MKNKMLQDFKTFMDSTQLKIENSRTTSCTLDNY